ncbi:putative phage tail protein [Paenibacillus agilis]|uniref:DUF2313 domain-containing protein n=1 Tax=Paenibacillus agilis TaxID=3020863 RepID=A0A559IW94_9BACL|nr:putative phage tail protein [Paenibacillus agilis]TVX91909.1 DUF2313 domain-containing protein [Paenibacillus agilis]
MSKLIDYLPRLYEDILEMIELTKTEEIELQAARLAVQQLLDDQYVLTASEDGIRRRERILKIQADPTTESLDFRRKRIINRYSTKPPFTIRYLQERLDYLVGTGRALATIDVQKFILTVTTAIDDASLFKEVAHTIKTILPANIVYQQSTALEDQITLQESITSQVLNRGTKLSTSWRLGATPFAVLGPEVVVK